MDSDKLLYQHDLPTPEPDSPLLPRARKPYRFSTLCATVENPNSSHKDQYGSSSVPIYQTSTFKGVGGEYDYSRSGNPTRTHLGEYLTPYCRPWRMGDEQLVCLIAIAVRASLGALLEDLHAAGTGRVKLLADVNMQSIPILTSFPLRTSYCKDIVRPACFRRLVRDGGSGRDYTSSQAQY